MIEPLRTAAERLELLCRFVNTLDYPNGPDDLGNAGSASRWNVENGLPPVADEGGVQRLRAFREALRGLLWSNNFRENFDSGAGASEALSPYLAGQSYAITASDSGLRLSPSGTGADAAIAQLVAIAYEAMLTGTWPRVRACRRDSCRFAYYDSSKNGARAWCSMAVCGNREKASRRRSRARARTKTQ